MRVRTKIRVLFLFVIGIALATSAVSLFSVSQLSAALQASNESLKTQLEVETLRSEIRAQATSELITNAVHKLNGAEHRFEVCHAGWFQRILPLELELADDHEMRTILTRLRDQITGIERVIDRGQKEVKASGKWQLSTDYLEKTFLPDLNRHVDGLLNLQQARAQATTDRATRSKQRLVVLVIVTSVLLLGVAVIGLALFRSWLLTPIETLSGATSKIAHGEYDTKIALTGKNEFARLARDVEKMSASIEHFQDQLVEKERMAAVGEMTASVAHNVRNPLASIRAISQNLRRDPSSSEPVKESMVTLMETVDRADRWLKDLLTALRPVKIAMREEDLSKVVEDIVVGSRVFSERKGIELELSIADDLPDVPLDRRKFEQALIVLISNAVEASENDSKVQVRVQPDPNGQSRVRVEVEDHGIGMSEESLKKLFTPYFTTKKSGVGLGLCLAQKIIFGHRGTIDVDSTLGHGCRMAIWLPTTNSSPEPS